MLMQRIQKSLVAFFVCLGMPILEKAGWSEMELNA